METQKCTLCQSEHDSEYLIYFQDSLLCQTCLDEETVICRRCSERVWVNDAEDGDLYRYLLVDEVKNISNTKKINTKDTKTKISSSLINHNSHLHIEAIKELNVDKMCQLMTKGDFGNTDKEISSSISIAENPSTIFNCQNDLYNHINTIDLGEYLGVTNNKFCCILPEHEDSIPSANIYTTDDGTQIYKCFGCDKARTIISITEHLARCKRSEAIEFIKSVYNLKLEESDWTS